MNRKEFLELFAKHLRRAKRLHGNYAMYRTGRNLERNLEHNRDSIYDFECPFYGVPLKYGASVHGYSNTIHAMRFDRASDYLICGLAID